MIRLGGPIFASQEDPRALARAHRAFGFSAAYCPSVDLSDSGRIAAIRKAFAAEDVVIAEIGAWCNMIAPQPEKRRANLESVCNRLALADAVGARCCVDYLGTLDPDSDFGPHPANLTEETFDLAVEVIRSVIDAVKPTRTCFSLETMQWILPDSVDAYAALVKAIDRKAFAVHMDPTNLVVSPRLYYNTGALIRECFEKLGSRIVSCHAKDLRIRNELALHFDEVRVGTGNLDYRVFLREISRMPDPAPLMLEHLGTEAEYAAARDYLLQTGRSEGIGFVA